MNDNKSIDYVTKYNNIWVCLPPSNTLSKLLVLKSLTSHGDPPWCPYCIARIDAPIAVYILSFLKIINISAYD